MVVSQEDRLPTFMDLPELARPHLRKEILKPLWYWVWLTGSRMQLAASVLHAGEGVVWVGQFHRFIWIDILSISWIFVRVHNAHEKSDATQKIPGPRFAQILTSFKPIHSSQGSPESSLASLLSRYTHFSTPTLAHLIALLSHFTSHRPPTNTSLIVIDSLSTLITAAFSREIDLLSTESKASKASPFIQNLADRKKSQILTPASSPSCNSWYLRFKR